MPLGLFDFEDTICKFCDGNWTDDFSEIYQQIEAEYLFGAFNEEQIWRILWED